MKTHLTRRTSFLFSAVSLGLLFLLSFSGCIGNDQKSEKESQLKETELSLRVRETLIAQQEQQGEQNTPEAQQGEQNTPEAQQAPTEDLQATQEAEANQTVVAEQTQAVFNADATTTQAAANELNITAEAVQRETAQAEIMGSEIQRLFEEGIISEQTGSYYRLQDFDKSVAQIDYLFIYSLGFEAENFVISTNLKWDSASDTANWPTSGCGFYYSKKDPDVFSLSATSLRLDGYGLVQQWVKGKGKAVAKKKAANISVPEGEAEIMLVVYRQHATLYVNGTQIVSSYDGLIGHGDFGYTVSSGTNAGFGTRCQMTEVDLWVFE